MMDLDRPEIAAFLATIAYSEGTWEEPDPYRVCFGYRHVINDLSDHPAVTGEWGGERLDPRLCQRAGIKSGRCRSTAAGAYQINKPTWVSTRKVMAREGIVLPNFGAESQDQAAWYLVGESGASAILLVSGDFESAIRKCAKRWASLPGAGYGQREKQMKVLKKFFEGRLRADETP